MISNIRERVRRGSTRAALSIVLLLSGVTASVAEEATSASDTIAAEVETAVPRFGPVTETTQPARNEAVPMFCGFWRPQGLDV